MTPTIPNRVSGSTLATYLCEIDHTPLLSAQEEKELACRIHDGDLAARDQMIRANLRLVVRMARTQLGHGVSLDDLIEEGNVGLIHAVEGFDPTMNTRFSTYAAYWIKQSMMRFVGSARTLPLPSYVIQELREWRREGTRLEVELNRRPTDEEINASLNFPARQVCNIKKALKVFASAHTGAGEPVLEETLASKTIRPEDQLVTKELLETVLHLLDELDKRESGVLRMRFGLQDSDPMSLQQIGDRLGLTRERVRQIEKEGLLKLHDRMQPSTDDEE